MFAQYLALKIFTGVSSGVTDKVIIDLRQVEQIKYPQQQSNVYSIQLVMERKKLIHAIYQYIIEKFVQNSTLV